MPAWELVHSTPLFTLERSGPEVYLIRYAKGIVINGALIEESLRVRRELVGRRPYVSIAVFPETATYAPDLFDTDLYEQGDPEHFVKALALVSVGGALIPVADHYYAEHPARITVQAFDNVPDALVWMERVMATHGHAWTAR